MMVNPHKAMHFSCRKPGGIVFFFFSFFWKKLNSRNVYNWQLFETKQTPSKIFRLRQAEPKGTLRIFFGLWWARQEKNPRNVHNLRPFESSETCSHESEFAISKLVFFFHFEPLKKRTNKQSFFSSFLNALLKISHRLSSKKR